MLIESRLGLKVVGEVGNKRENLALSWLKTFHEVKLPIPLKKLETG